MPAELNRGDYMNKGWPFEPVKGYISTQGNGPGDGDPGPN
jgi:hypothetical protein